MPAFVSVTLAAGSVPSDDGLLADGVVLAVVGIGLVFAALVLIWLAVALLTRFAAARSASPEAAAPAAVADVPSDEVDGRVLAILTAAAIAALGPGARIRQVCRVRRDGASAWAEHGRVVVQSSHNNRKH